MTTFADGLFQYGGQAVTPGVPVPFTGTHYWVDPVNGSDGNSGKTPDRAFSTLYKAHASCTAGKNDVVFLIGNGAASGTARLSAASSVLVDSTLTTGELIWSKNATHLIGVSAPGVNSRARISNPTGTYTAATFGSNTMMTVSGNGCYIANVSLTQSFSTGNASEITMVVSGDYNVFNNVFLSGGLSAAAYGGTGSRALKITAADENLFVNCQIGADTVTRSVLNANLELASAAARNVFKGCVFPVYTSSATSVCILGTGAGCVDRFTLFDRCAFINAVDSGSTGMTALANFTNAAPGGSLIFKDCDTIGMTKIGDTNALANSYVSGVGGAATGGLDVNPS